MCDQTAIGSLRDAASARILTALKGVATSQHIDADAVIQQTIQKFLERCEDILTKRNPPAYVMIMLKNEKINEFRSARRFTNSLDDPKAIETYITNPWQEIGNPFSDYRMNESRIKILELADPVLSPRLKEVLDCKLEGMTNKEVADKLGITENTVKEYVKDITINMKEAYGVDLD